LHFHMCMRGYYSAETDVPVPAFSRIDNNWLMLYLEFFM
jgi:hypothetical protein